jgi:hypothetical protein
MLPDHIDLLPEDRRRALMRAYILRLVTVAAVVMIILTIAASALLVPAYLYLVSVKRTETAHLATLTSALSARDEASLAGRLSMLQLNAGAIIALAQTSSASTVLKQTLAIGRPGIVLSGVNYAVATGRAPYTLTLSGTASSRNDLRSYQLSLLAAPGFITADLPVSSYAKDHDIPFTITVGLASTTAP